MVGIAEIFDILRLPTKHGNSKRPGHAFFYALSEEIGLLGGFPKSKQRYGCEAT
jgi:hypothetical protein